MPDADEGGKGVAIALNCLPTMSYSTRDWHYEPGNPRTGSSRTPEAALTMNSGWIPQFAPVPWPLGRNSSGARSLLHVVCINPLLQSISGGKFALVHGGALRW